MRKIEDCGYLGWFDSNLICLDLPHLPKLTFTDVEKYAARSTGCESTAKAYKYFAEARYLHNIKGKVHGK